MKNTIIVFSATLLLSFLGLNTVKAQYHDLVNPCGGGGIPDLVLDGYQTVYVNNNDCDSSDPEPCTCEQPPFEFNIYFNSMQVLLDMNSALAGVERRRAEEWLGRQEETFRQEINRQLGTDHSSFRNAQLDFYKNYENNLLRLETTASNLAIGHRAESLRLDRVQEDFTAELKLISDWQQIGASCAPYGILDCGDLGSTNIRGTQLRHMSNNTIENIWDDIVLDFSEKEFRSAENSNLSQGIVEIVADRSLLNGMVGNHMAYYHSKNLQDKVFLMTAYLVQHYYRNSGVLVSPPLSQYDVPPFWDNNIIVDKGAARAPEMSDCKASFDRDYEPLMCRGEAEYIPGADEECRNVTEELANCRENIIRRHIADLEDYSELGMTIKLERIRSGYVSYNGSGKIAGLDALEYSNYVLDDGGPNRFYQLTNGGWVYESNHRRPIEGGVPSSEPSLNANGLFYYLKNDETGHWHELLLPATGIPTADDPYFVKAFWEVVGTTLRYATPLEDVLILIDGRDFDGNDASQAAAGVWLVAGFVPGGKLVKPLTRITRGGLELVAKVVKIGEKTYHLTYRTVDNLIVFGGRSRFREIVGAVTGEEAHHIIPWAQRVHEVVQKAAKWGFHMNDRINGIPLEKYFQGVGGVHGNHPAYNDYVFDKLEDWKGRNPGFNAEDAVRYLEQELIPELLDLINIARSSGLNLNDFFRNL